MMPRDALSVCDKFIEFDLDMSLVKRGTLFEIVGYEQYDIGVRILKESKKWSYWWCVNLVE